MVTRFIIIRSTLNFVCCVIVGIAGNIFAEKNQENPIGRRSGHNDIKNIIVLVPDGCNQAIQTLSRWYKGSDLSVDKMTSGMARTWSANSVITGSAAASTAFGTGFKTEEPFIGVAPGKSNLLSTYQYPFPPDYFCYRPLATVLEAAKSVGKATGLVATVTMSHATPGGQCAHVDNRSDELGIMEQEVYQNIDVVFGGGKNKLVTRTDGENLLDTLISRGYQWVETRDQMLALSSGKVWGLFAGEYMQPDIDRKEFAPNEPTLSEMTRKAIELLSRNPKGFFLFVEASQTDFGDHNNDPIYSISDFLAFDEAVRTAVEFAKSDGHTAVIAFPDHNCGGMTIGSYSSDRRVAYDKMPVEYLLNPLKGMKLSSVGVANKIIDKTDPAQIKNAVQLWWNIQLADSDVAQILTWPNSSIFNYKLAAVVSKNYTGIGWTTHGHDGSDVPIWSYNCEIRGSIENTEIAEKLFEMLDVDSKKINENLFVDVNDAFPGAWTLDKTDAANPVLIVTVNSTVFRLPVSKDELYCLKQGGATVKKFLSGLVVNAPKTNRVYIPKDAVRKINKMGRDN
jgi:alkaline phosphatase